MSNYIGIDTSLTVYYLIDLFLIVAVLASMRKLSGIIANVSSKAELAERDNHAFGISVAGAALALAIMLMGAVSGEAAINPFNEVLVMLAYGGAGLLLMWLTRKIFDHIALPDISIHDEIMKGNISAAIVDIGNMIATAIILRAIMIWVDTNSFIGVSFVAIGFVLSQFIMIGATIYRRRVYLKRHQDSGLQKQIAAGNTALALRFSGHRIGIALAVSAASGIVKYNEINILPSISVWLLSAITMFIALTLIAIVTRKMILPEINVSEEVDNQRNVAIGSIEGAVYIAVGFLLAGLFG